MTSQKSVGDVMLTYFTAVCPFTAGICSAGVPSSNTPNVCQLWGLCSLGDCDRWPLTSQWRVSMCVKPPFGDKYSITDKTVQILKHKNNQNLCLNLNWKDKNMPWKEQHFCEMNGERERCREWGEMFSRQPGIRCGSVNMLGSLVYFVPSGKNRPSSRGKWWRLLPACIISHKSASSSYWKRQTDIVWGEHQWSPWQHMQSDAGKSNWKDER